MQRMHSNYIVSTCNNVIQYYIIIGCRSITMVMMYWDIHIHIGHYGNDVHIHVHRSLW